MGNLSVWLLAMAGPMVGRILLSLGFSVVTITGVDVALTTIKGLLVGHLQNVPAAGMQMALLAGVGTAIGMIFGAIAVRLMIWQLTNATKIMGVK